MRCPRECSGPAISMTRRSVLAAITSFTASALAACRLVVSPGENHTAPGSRLIDAHCHLFNISDLPAATFVQQVLLHVPPGTAQADHLLSKLLAIEALLSSGVRRAKDESGNGLIDDAEPPPPLEAQLEKLQSEAEEALAEARGSALIECPEGPSPSPSVGSVIHWFKAFRSSRRGQTQTLVRATSTGGYNPALLCPALVDFSNWLGQSLSSPLPDQAKAMAAVASMPDLPPVHGYFGFDPLRRALIRTGRPSIDGGWDPLAQAERALSQDGFAGIKLYPPMGFRPSGNGASGQGYPDHVEKAFGSGAAAGVEIDHSLEELWKLCLAEDAPIIAHAASSNGSRRGYGARADPSYWFPVIRRHTGLRILLAHFGRFVDQAAEMGPPTECSDDSLPFIRTWDAAVGRFLRNNPGSNLFVDLSYLSDLFSTKWRNHALAGFREYLRYDPDARHVMFGSDWVMLGIEKGWHAKPAYPARVATFLKEAGLGPSAIDGVLYGNAVRFLGLETRGRTRSRLERFYLDRGLVPKPLPGI